MSFGQIDLTLGAAATQLTDERLPAVQVIIDNSHTGNDAIYIGTSAVTSSLFGASLAAGEQLTIGPFEAGRVNLNEIYLFGTQNDVVHVLYVLY